MAELSDLVTKLEEGNEKSDSMNEKLDSVARILSIESAEEKQARQDAADFADATKQHYEEQLRLSEQGVENSEELQKAQEDMIEAAREAAEKAEKRSMFDRLAGDEPPGPSDPADPEDDEENKSFFKGKKFKNFFKMITGFLGILSVLILPALAYALNNEKIFNTLKGALFSFIDFIGFLVDNIGVLNTALLGFVSFFAIMNPFKTFGIMKATFLIMKGLLVKAGSILATGATMLTSFLGIGLAPLIGIIAGIAAVGYAIYDTFLEVKKAFDEGASVPELIRVAIVNFYGAFGKILDFIKDLIADVLEFFGFEDLAKSFKEFSFEKLIEDFLNGIMDGVKDLLNFDFKGMFQSIMADILMNVPGGDATRALIPDAVFEFAGIDSSGKKLEDPEVRKKRLADEQALKEAQEAKDKEVRRIQRELGDVTEESIDADKSVAKIQKDVNDPDSNYIFKETEEEQAEDLEDLKNERAKAAALEERRLALLEQLVAAQSAPVVVQDNSQQNSTTAPTVVEGSKALENPNSAAAVAKSRDR